MSRVTNIQRKSRSGRCGDCKDKKEMCPRCLRDWQTRVGVGVKQMRTATVQVWKTM